MQIRADLGFRYLNGMFHTVTCFNNGNPENLGKILIQYHNHIDFVRQLVAYGDMNNIGVDLTSTDFIRPKSTREETVDFLHKYETPYHEVAQHRNSSFIYVFNQKEYPNEKTDWNCFDIVNQKYVSLLHIRYAKRL